MFPCTLNFVRVLGGDSEKFFLPKYLSQLHARQSCRLDLTYSCNKLQQPFSSSPLNSAVPICTIQPCIDSAICRASVMHEEHRYLMATALTQPLLSTSKARGHKRSRRRKVTQAVFSWEFGLILRMSSSVLMTVTQTWGGGGRTSSLHRMGTLWHSGIGY